MGLLVHLYYPLYLHFATSQKLKQVAPPLTHVMIMTGHAGFACVHTRACIVTCVCLYVPVHRTCVSVYVYSLWSYMEILWRSSSKDSGF